MPKMSTRGLTAVGASAAMLSAAVLASTGAGVAGAVPVFNSPGCSLENSKALPGGFLWADFNITKKVQGDGEVAADGQVTYTSVVSTTSVLLPPSLESISDIHPAGFTLVKAEVESWSRGALGQKWADVTKSAVHNGNKITFGASPLGWSTLDETVTLKTTYRVPSQVVLGAELDSGAAFKTLGFAGAAKFDTMGVCVKIRAKNAVESATGSLGGLGLGSSELDGLGRAEMTGSVSDPGGSLAGSLTGFLGGLLGS